MRLATRRKAMDLLSYIMPESFTSVQCWRDTATGSGGCTCSFPYQLYALRQAHKASSFSSRLCQTLNACRDQAKTQPRQIYTCCMSAQA